MLRYSHIFDRALISLSGAVAFGLLSWIAQNVDDIPVIRAQMANLTIMMQDNKRSAEAVQTEMDYRLRVLEKRL